MIMTEYNMTKQFAKDFRKNLAKYEKNLIEISTDNATDALRNTDWSSSLLDIIKDELHHYKHRLRQALAKMDYTVEFNSKTPELETKNGIIP